MLLFAMPAIYIDLPLLLSCVDHFCISNFSNSVARCMCAPAYLLYCRFCVCVC